jgi:hypothetical protein
MPLRPAYGAGSAATRHQSDKHFPLKKSNCISQGLFLMSPMQAPMKRKMSMNRCASGGQPTKLTTMPATTDAPMTRTRASSLFRMSPPAAHV